MNRNQIDSNSHWHKSNRKKWHSLNRNNWHYYSGISGTNQTELANTCFFLIIGGISCFLQLTKTKLTITINKEKINLILQVLNKIIHHKIHIYFL